MQRSWGDRGYVEPIAALAAVFALGVGLTVYAGALADHSPTSDRERAPVVLDSVAGDASVLGVTDPRALDVSGLPAGWSVNLTLETGSGRWTRGEVPAPTAERATRRVSVRVEPGSIEPGRLCVAVW